MHPSLTLRVVLDYAITEFDEICAVGTLSSSSSGPDPSLEISSSDSWEVIDLQEMLPTTFNETSGKYHLCFHLLHPDFQEVLPIIYNGGPGS